jgi:hypothetical protein
MRSLGKALKIENGCHESIKHTGSVVTQPGPSLTMMKDNIAVAQNFEYATAAPSHERRSIPRRHVPKDGHISPRRGQLDARTKGEDALDTKRCHINAQGVQKPALPHRPTVSYPASAGGTPGSIERRLDAAQSTDDLCSTPIMEQNPNRRNGPLALDPGIAGAHEANAGPNQSCRAPLLESFESSSGPTDLDGEDAISLSGLSTYSEELNRADECTWLEMSKAAMIDKFLDDIECCVDEVVGGIVSQYCLSDMEGTGAESNSKDGAGNIDVIAATETTGYAHWQASNTGNSLHHGSNNDDDEDDEEQHPFNHQLNIPADRGECSIKHADRTYL